MMILMILLLVPPKIEFQKTLEGLQKFQEETGKEKSIATVVEYFVGRPYLVGSLEGDGPEEVRYHLDGFDCFTLTESALAFFTLTTVSPKAYEDFLLQTRYRDGHLDGYASRIHYASEWTDQAVALGYLEDVTPKLEGAKPWEKDLDYMTHHRSAYPKMASDQVFNKIQDVEQSLKGRVRSYLPLERLEDNANRLKRGDIIAILTQKPGLDVGHFCYVTQPSSDDSNPNQIEMVHASSTKMEIVKVQDLFNYVRHYPKVLGIMVFRVPETHP